MSLLQWKYLIPLPSALSVMSNILFALELFLCRVHACPALLLYHFLLSVIEIKSNYDPSCVAELHTINFNYQSVLAHAILSNDTTDLFNLQYLLLYTCNSIHWSCLHLRFQQYSLFSSFLVTATKLMQGKT